MTVQFFRITKDNYIERKYEQIAFILYDQVKDFIKPSIGDTITVNGYRGEVTTVNIDYNYDAIDIFGRFDKID